MKIWWIFKTNQDDIESLFPRNKTLGINISPKWKLCQKLFIKVLLKRVHILQVHIASLVFWSHVKCKLTTVSMDNRLISLTDKIK